MLIDSSIETNIKVREYFDVSDEGKGLHSLKSIRIRDTTPTTAMKDDVFRRDLKTVNCIGKEKCSVMMFITLKCISIN